MNNARRLAFGFRREAITRWFFNYVTRLNQSEFVRDASIYLDHLTFPAQVVSLGYSVWEWSKRKFDSDSGSEQAIEKESNDTNFVEVNLMDRVENSPKNNDRDPEREKKIQKLLEAKRREALKAEQREAWILTLTAKDL